MKKEVFICMDIGGTNCRLSLVDEKLNLERHRSVSTRALEEEGVVEALTRLLKEEIEEVKVKFLIKGVILGVPATIDKNGRTVLSTPNIKGFNMMPVADILEKELNLQVYLEKDVNLLLLADINCFALPEQASIVGIYFGTGIGNSIYISGQFWRGKNGVAGEIGHIPQLRLKKECGCGNFSCLETLGGGKRLQELCREVFVNTKIEEIYSKHLDTPEIQEHIEAMAVAVASEINIMDPDYVIVGGGLPIMKDFPKKLFEEMIRKHTRGPYPKDNTRILYSNGGQESGLMGAGLLGWKIKNYKFRR